jgi:hypothetical protein
MDETQQQTTTEAAKGPDFDFESVYANNSNFEPSVWDLKIIFGQLEQHTGNAEVDWHTAVTMPWMQAKLLCYYLRVNLAIHEAQNGPISVHRNVIPILQPPVAGAASDTNAQQVYEIITKIHAEVFG